MSTKKYDLDVVLKSFLPEKTKKLVAKAWKNLSVFKSMVIVKVLECHNEARKKCTQKLREIKGLGRRTIREINAEVEKFSQEEKGAESVLKKIDSINYQSLSFEKSIWWKEQRLVFLGQAPKEGLQNFVGQLDSKVSGDESPGEYEVLWAAQLEKAANDMYQNVEDHINSYKDKFKDFPETLKKLEELQEKRLAELDKQIGQIQVPEIRSGQDINTLVLALIDTRITAESKMRFTEVEASEVYKEIQENPEVFQAKLHLMVSLFRLSDSDAIRSRILKDLEEEGLFTAENKQGAQFYLEYGGDIVDKKSSYDDYANDKEAIEKTQSLVDQHPEIKPMVASLAQQVGYRFVPDDVPSLIDIHKSGATETVVKLFSYFNERFVLSGLPWGGEWNRINLTAGLIRIHSEGLSPTIIRLYPSTQAGMEYHHLWNSDKDIDLFVKFNGLPEQEKQAFVDVKARLIEEFPGWTKERKGKTYTYNKYLFDIRKDFDAVSDISRLSADDQERIIRTTQKLSKPIRYEFTPKDAEKLLQISQWSAAKEERFFRAVERCRTSNIDVCGLPLVQLDNLISFVESGVIDTVVSLKEKVNFYFSLVQHLDDENFAAILSLHRSGALATIIQLKELGLYVDDFFMGHAKGFMEIHGWGRAKIDRMIVLAQRFQREIPQFRFYLYDAKNLLRLDDAGAMETAIKVSPFLSNWGRGNGGDKVSFMDWDTNGVIALHRANALSTVQRLYDLKDELGLAGLLQPGEISRMIKIHETGVLSTIRELHTRIGYVFEVSFLDDLIALHHLAPEKKNAIIEVAPKVMEVCYLGFSVADQPKLLLIAESGAIDAIMAVVKSRERGKVPDLIELGKLVDLERLAHDEKYRKIFVLISEGGFLTDSRSIEEKIRGIPYFIAMDYPLKRTEVALRAFDRFMGRELESLFDEEEFFDFFGVDYRSTDARVGGIDTKEVLGEGWISSTLEQGVNLRTFDTENIDAYEKLFNFIRETSLTGWEKQILAAIDYRPFAEFTRQNDLTTNFAKIRECQNRIHPKIDKFLLAHLEVDLDDFAVLKKYVRVDSRFGQEMIDVTQNNLVEVNTLLQTFLLFRAKEDFPFQQILESLFSDYEPKESFEENFLFLMERLNIEEINFQAITDLDQLKNLLELQSVASKFRIEAAERYLLDRFGDVDLLAVFARNKLSEAGSDQFFCCDVATIEKMRIFVNAHIDRVSGDRLVISLATNFLSNNPASYENLNLLMLFAKNWQDANVYRDIKGIYSLASNFAYNKIVRFIYRELGAGQKNKEQVEEKLGKQGLSLTGIANELDSRGIPIDIKLGNAQKFMQNVLTGRTQYAVRKANQKTFGGEGKIETVEGMRIERVKWQTHEGVEVYEIVMNGEEQAKVVKCQRDQVGIRQLMEQSGIVDMQAEENANQGELIFSAPLAFTTGNHKMTEIAIRDGEIMNYLLSTDGKDGLVISDQDGDLKILNKTRLELDDFKDLGVEIDETSSLGQKISTNRSLDVMNNLEDFMLFIRIMQEKKLSLLSNMLLIDDGNIEPYGNDGADSRRFLVEFQDGSIGIIDSSQNMATNSLMEIAGNIGVRNAVYMDTGMYDKATYYEPGGEKHVLGHVDTDESTNRVVIYAKRQDD